MEEIHTLALLVNGMSSTKTTNNTILPNTVFYSILGSSMQGVNSQVGSGSLKFTNHAHKLCLCEKNHDQASRTSNSLIAKHNLEVSQ